MPGHTVVRLKREANQNISYINVMGELDISTADEFQQELFDALKQKPDAIVVRMKHVPYMDSAGVAVILEVVKAMRAKGGSVRILEPSDAARRALNMVDLSALVNFYDDIESCAECLKVSPTAVRTQILSRDELSGAGITV